MSTPAVGPGGSGSGSGSISQQIERALLRNDTSRIGQFSDDLKELIRQAGGSSRNREVLQLIAFKLLNRVFGEEIYDVDMAVDNPGWVNENASVHASSRGGWLRRLCTRSVMMARGDVRLPDAMTFRDHGIDSLAMGTRKLVALLLPRSEFLAVMTSGRFKAKMKLEKFPVKAQICIRQFPYYECVRSPNQIVYFAPYFHVPSNEQAQPLLRDDTNPAMMVDFKELFFISILRFPKDYPSAFELVNIRYQNGVDMGPLARSVATVSDPAHSIPGLVFGKLADILHTTPIGFLNRSGIFGWIDGSPYLVLLHESLRDFVPHGASESGYDYPRSGDMKRTPGSASSSSSNRRGQSNMRTRGFRSGDSLYEKVRLSQAGELFLRLMAEYWMDVATLIRRNHADGVSFKAQLNKTVEYFTAGPKHPLPTDILALDASSMRWESSTMQCNYIVLLRMLSDPSLADQYQAIVMENAAFTESPLAHGGKTGMSGSRGNIIAAPPAISIIQQPLFDMLRTIFSKAQQFTGSDRDMYALAVEVWLLYLQPWKAPSLAKGTPLARVEKTPELHGARYERDVWLPYIACNHHFYTTLLACFIQSIASMDISATEEAGMVHLLLLEKVLVAFDAFNHDLESLTEDFRSWYATCSRDAYGGAMSRTIGGMGGMGLGLGGTPMRSTLSPVNSSLPTPRTGSATPSRGGMATSLGLLVAMKSQHISLYPDPAIDRDVPHFGIVSVSEYCSSEAQKLISTLHTVMRDVNNRKGGAAILESVAEVLDHLLNMNKWGLGQNFGFTSLVRGISSAGQALSSAGHAASNAVLSERLNHDVRRIDALVKCGLPSGSGSPRALGKEDGITLAVGPGAAAAGVDSGEGEGSGLHDEMTGVLTPAGKQRLLAGEKLAVDDLRWFDDVLLLPFCTYEVHFLADFTNLLSQRLNAKYDLPGLKASARWPWSRVFSHLRQVALMNDVSIGVKVAEAKKLYRFNLRFLAAVRVACPAAMLVLHYIVPQELVGYYKFLLLAFLSFLTFRNTTYVDNMLRSITLLVAVAACVVLSQLH